MSRWNEVAHTRILWVSKAAITPSYRTKIIALVTRYGHEVGIVTGRAWAPWHYEPSLDDDRLQWFFLPQYLSGHNHFHGYRGLGRTIAQFRPDILHVDEEHYSWVTSQAFWLARRTGRPRLIFQTWQNIFKQYPWPFRALERYVFHTADAAIAGNQEALAVLRRKGYQGPARVIPLATPLSHFFPRPKDSARTRWRLPATPFLVGYVGRLVPEKGLDDLLAALAPRLRSGTMEFVVAGNGPWQSLGQEAARQLGIDARIHWIPWVSTDEMPELLAALNCLVLPSRTTPHWKEQFGRILIEAMACEIPVVGSDSGEIPQVIGEAGLIVPEGDPTRLGDALDRLYQSPALCRELGRRGRERVFARYSPEAVAGQFHELYHLLVGEGPV
ncbi:MAG: glycosyltransferase [Sulfobacillus sp.]|nr:glycosyltransferase [Sulfobacillus sp.]